MYKKEDLIFCLAKYKKLYALKKDMLVNFELFNRYPYIFHKLFNIDTKLQDKLALISDLFFKNICCLDKLCEEKGLSFEYIVENYVVGNELILELRNIFNDRSIFWDKYRDLYKDYFDALYNETQIKRGLYTFKNKDEYFTLNKKKCSLTKVAVYAMAVLSKKADTYKQVEEFLDYFNIFIQLYDDFKDVKEDIQNNQNNYYIQCAYSKCKEGTYEEVKYCYYKYILETHILDMENIMNLTYENYIPLKNMVPEFENILLNQKKLIKIIKKEVL